MSSPCRVKRFACLDSVWAWCYATTDGYCLLFWETNGDRAWTANRVICHQLLRQSSKLQVLHLEGGISRIGFNPPEVKIVRGFPYLESDLTSQHRNYLTHVYQNESWKPWTTPWFYSNHFGTDQTDYQCYRWYLFLNPTARGQSIFRWVRKPKSWWQPEHNSKPTSPPILSIKPVSK